MAITKKDNKWEVAPNLTSDRTLATSGAFLDADIVIKNGEASFGKTQITRNADSISGTTYAPGSLNLIGGKISEADSVAGATFANTATSGVFYRDISNTTAAPVLVTQDYLYINEGYTKPVKISLAKLVPDGTGTQDINATAGTILSGYYAWDKDGKAIAGNIVTKTDSGNVTLNGTTTTKSFAAGYYPNAHGAAHVTVTIPGPTITWDSDNNVIKATSSWTAGFTTNTSYSSTKAITSLDSNFVAENIKTGVTIFGVTGTVGIDTFVTDGKYTATGAVTDEDIRTYAKLDVASGTVTPSATLKTAPTVNTTISTPTTGYGFTTTKPTSGSYVTLTSSTNGVSSNGVVTPKYTNTAGWIEEHSKASGTDLSIINSVADGTGVSYYQPIVSVTGAGGGASIKTSSTSATNGNGVTMTDTDTDPGSGVYITTGGKATPTRAAITYSNSAGAITAHNAGTSLIAAADGAETTLTTNKYYLTKITIPASKTFDVEASGTLTATADSATTGTIKLNAYNNNTTPSLTGVKEVVTNGKWNWSTLRAMVGTATFTNCVTTTAENSSRVELVTAAGYTDKRWISSLTMTDGTSSTYKDLTINQNGYDILRVHGNSSANNGPSRVYFGDQCDSAEDLYPGSVYVGNWNTTRNRGGINILSLLGCSTTNTRYDRITTLNVGTSATNKYGYIATLNLYGEIGYIVGTTGFSLISNLKNGINVTNLGVSGAAIDTHKLTIQNQYGTIDTTMSGDNSKVILRDSVTGKKWTITMNSDNECLEIISD